MTRLLLHVLTDPALSRGRSHREIVVAALAGGADVIQLRDKTALPENLVEEAVAIRRLVAAAGAKFVVNDSVDLALELDAHGVHLGPEDLPVAEARVCWPRPKLLGASAREPARARALEAAGADYLGVGPVFGTTTKTGASPAIGLKALATVAAAVKIPVIAIGGVDATNAASAIAAGAAGVAVISAVVGAPDVERAARELRRAIDGR